MLKIVVCYQEGAIFLVWWGFFLFGLVLPPHNRRNISLMLLLLLPMGMDL